MNTNVLTRVDCDRDLVYLWLGDKSRTTVVCYSSIVTGFLNFINKPLCEVAIEDLQLWHRRLRITDKPSTVANKIRAIKSLFSYGVKVGYLEINVGSYINVPKSRKNSLQRILSESDCLKLIEATKTERNRALLCLMYGCGLRVSEVCALTWDDLQPCAGARRHSLFANVDSALPKVKGENVMSLVKVQKLAWY